MRCHKKSKLSRYVLAALTVGMFSMVPVAYALPVQDTGHTNTAGSAINTSVANQMGITSTASNNVMNWQSFSIANGEKVQFDTNNYLNLVRGASKSEIDGALTGGGTIYLINPNGILFGSTAQVNVGNLVASTRAIADVNQAVFLGAGDPLTTAATSAAGDIVNLGKLQTAKLVLEGNNITIQNAADITSDGTTALTSTVTAKAAGIITVGHKVTETTTRSFTINGAAMDKTVHDYANDTYAGSGYTTSKLDSATANVTKEYMLVENVYDLQNMDAKLSGSYMLSGDINASETSSWNTGAGFSPVANGYDGFTGTFDGANHTITGLYINRPATEYRVGLFGYSTGTIQNVGLVGGSITGKDGVGGVVGWNSSGTITNAYNTGAVSGNESVGGVVGQNSSGTITNAYNTGAVSGNEYVGGVAGQNYTDYGTITNVYNTGAVSGNESVGGVVGLDYSSSPITNALWAKDLEYTPTKGVKPTQALGNIADTDTVKGETVANMKKAATYSNWTGTNAVSSIGGAGTAWRIYEGNTTPLLTSFFKGVVTVTGLDNQTVTYNSTIQKADLSGATYSPSNIDASHILAGGDRNVGTYSAIYSDQQGYDLVNTNTLTITPKTLTATLTGNVFTKIYDGGTDVKQAMGNNYSFATGDVESGDTVSLTGTGTYADKNVGNNKTVTFSGITLTGADAGNYTIAATLSGNVGQITKKELTAALTGTNSISKVYDGDNKVTAALTQGTNYQFTGMVAGDTLSLTGTGTYDDKNVATGKAVSFTGLSLTGADAGNYTIAATLSGNVGQITKKELTAALTGTNSISKVYDGDNKVTAALTQGTNYQFTGMVAGDTLSLTGTGTYDDKNVATGKAVSFTDLSLTGADAGNYNFTTASLSDTVGQITKKELTAALTGTNSISKVYDGDNKVTAALTQGTNYQFTGMVAGDTLSLTGTGTYDDKNVATGKAVSFTGLSLTGADAGNYNFTTTSLSDTVGQITKKELTAALTGTNSISKVYDGDNKVTAALTQGTNYRFTGMVAGDTLSLTGTGTYDDKNVATGKAVSFTGLSLTGADAGNYTIAATLSGNVGQITKKELTAALTGTNSISKVYDGDNKVTAALTQGTNYQFTGMVANDVLGLTGTGTYTDNKNVGDGKAVSFTGLSLTGADAGNYNFTTTSLSDTVGQITKKELTAALTGTNSISKVYDGDNKVTAALTQGTNYQFTGMVDKDVLGLTGTGTYTDNKNVGDGKAVSFTGLSLTGADAGNYTIAATLSGNVGQITKKELTAALTGTNSISKVYDGDNKVTAALTQGTNYQFTGMVAGDTLSLTGTGTYADNKNAGDDKPVSFTGLSLTGTDAGNYNLTTTSLTGNVGQITKKDLTADLTGTNSVSKVYDGYNTVTAALTQGTNYQFTGMVAGDTLSLTGTGTYTDDKNVGNGKPVSFTGLNFTGTEAGNYNLTTTSLTGNVGQITSKKLTITLAGNNTFTKVYDGTTDVIQKLAGNYNISGIVGTEKVDIDSAGVSGTYADKNAADGKLVQFTVSGLTGADKANYSLESTTLTGNVGKITPKALTATLTGDNVFTKVYDGTTVVNQTLGTNYTLDGIVADSDKVSLTAGSGAYNDKNVGDSKTITFSGLTLSGEGAGNYTIASALSGNVGQITKKSLVAEMNNGASFTKVYDGTTAVNTALVLDINYAFAEGDVVTGDAVSIDATKAVGTYADKNAGSNKAVNFTNLTLTGTDAGNYELFDMEMGITGAGITPKALTATVTGDNVFTKVYDGTTTVSQALGTNYALDGIMADSDKVSLTAGSGAYNDKNAGDNKTLTFSGLTLTGTGAGNYNLTTTSLSGNAGQITKRTITGSLASGYSFDKVYDGTTTATLGNGYALNGVVAGDKVPLTAAKGFYDSSAVGDRTVTFSGFSINDGNYLLSMADSLSGTGKITSGSQDHNYSDALTGVSSSFGANPSDGYTIFSGAPEDYVPRAVTKNNGQSYQVGVSQVTQTWYNGPATITIINGGITMPKNILLGSTYDTRKVVLKGGNSYEI